MRSIEKCSNDDRPRKGIRSANGSTSTAIALLTQAVPHSNILPMQHRGFRLARWGHIDNSGFGLCQSWNMTDCVRRRILEHDPKSQHKPTTIESSITINSVPTRPVKRGNVRKADWMKALTDSTRQPTCSPAQRQNRTQPVKHGAQQSYPLRRSPSAGRDAAKA